jgi:predicted PurR-regulated permease PerM
MTMSPAPPPTKVEERINSRILILLSLSILGFICSILSQANPGGAWGLLAGFGALVGLLGIAAAVLIAVVSAAFRRVSLTFLLFIFLEISGAALLLWFATKLVKSP